MPVRLRIVAGAVALAAMLGSPAIARAQMGESGLSWQQRFLGIIPLVKPDPKDPVAVTVDGTAITVGQVGDYAKTEERLINAATSEEEKAVWKDATENLISRQLLIEEAHRRNVTVPDAEVAQRAREYNLASSSGEELAKSGPPDPDLLKAVRDSMVIEKMLDDEFRAHHVRPTPEQIQKYYVEHKDLFVKDPGQVRISHIAVKLSEDATDAQKDAARRKIQKLYAEAQKTKDFAALARKYSEDSQSAPKGGDLGLFRPGQLPPVVDKLVFATPVGHLTEIVESNLGFSFIKVTARQGETFASLKESSAKIAMVLLDYDQDAVVRELLKKLAKNAHIEFHKPS
ncbi:MAG TPA: peptidylprolyl isomerase [Candidatus Binataceae bacterium]|nr:peptidylprolyl isomerase [Candidatus Binataceae bacterium]